MAIKTHHTNFGKETAVDKDTQITLPFASISGKKVTADFDGGRLRSDAGVVFLREVERGIGLIKRLADVLRDDRHQSYVEHLHIPLCFDDPLRSILTTYSPHSDRAFCGAKWGSKSGGSAILPPETEDSSPGLSPKLLGEMETYRGVQMVIRRRCVVT